MIPIERLRDIGRVIPGFLNVDWASKDPDLVCLHDEPKSRAIVGR